MRKIIIFLLVICICDSLLARELKIGLDTKMHPKFSDQEGRLAVNILIDEVLSKWIKQINYQSSEIVNYTYVDTLMKDYADRKIDGGLIGPRDFAKYKDTILLMAREVLSVKYNKGKYIQLGFVMPKKKQNLPMSDWQNKTLAMDETPFLSDYLDLYCLENYKKSAKNFFSNINTIDTEGLAVMDIFFKKADIAFVSKGAFETNAMLNPQIAKKFIFLPLMKIPDTPVLIFFNDSLPKTDIKSLGDSVEEFFSTPRGEQIKSLLMLENVATVSNEDLKSIVDSYKRLENLRAKY